MNRTLPLLVFLLHPWPAQAGPPDGRMSCLDDGTIRIGVNLDRGGSIGYFAEAATGENVVNVHDLGRWIGQSYYSGPQPYGAAHPAWKNWPWNPVSAGDVYAHPSRLLETKNDGKTLYVKTTPMQWALNGAPAECTFETWITLDGRAARVKNRLTNRRSDHTQYPARDQELPAAYSIGRLHRLIAYDGEHPFTNEPTREIPKRTGYATTPLWTGFAATEHWAALVDDRGWGLGVYHPDVITFLGGFYGGRVAGGPMDDPTGYLAPLRKEILDHDIVYEYEYVLILDFATNIRRYAYEHRSKSNAPDYRFEKDRRHWALVNAEDAGFPIKGCLRLKVEKADPQMISPEGLWDASEVPVLYIRAAHRTKDATAELFWRTWRTSGFSKENCVRFAVKTDGRFHTYAVRLADSPTYRGKISALRFDPAATGGAGESVDVAFISASNDVRPLK